MGAVGGAAEDADFRAVIAKEGRGWSMVVGENIEGMIIMMGYSCLHYRGCVYKEVSYNMTNFADCQNMILDIGDRYSWKCSYHLSLSKTHAYVARWE